MTPGSELVTYDVSEAQIAETRAKYAALTADTPAGYEDVRLAIAFCRETRVSIEKRRVELKADALAFGRLVDTEAKRWTALLEEIEEPLRLKKSAVDDEKARVKAEAEAAKVRAIEAELQAKREQEEAERRAAREAEEARLAEERARLAEERRLLDAQRAEQEEIARKARAEEEARVADERAKMAAERKEAEAKQRAEREAIEKDRRKVAEERERAERTEFERQAKIKAEKDAAAKVEREALEAAQRQARIDALKPDAEKIRAFTAAIRELKVPTVKTKAAREMVSSAVLSLNSTADTLDSTLAAVSA